MTGLSAIFGIQQEDWMKDGACRGQDPSIFVLDQGLTTAKAVEFCRRCTVRSECEAYARKTGSTGVWGGKLFTPREYAPVELLPIAPVQDARPRQQISHRSLGRVPSVLGNAASSLKSLPGPFAARGGS